MALNFPPQSIGGALPPVGQEWYDASSDTTWEVIDHVSDGTDTIAVWQIKLAGSGSNFGGIIDITIPAPSPLPPAGTYYVVKSPGGTGHGDFGNLAGETFVGGEQVIYTGEPTDPWIQIGGTLPEATTSQRGIIQLATVADILAQNDEKAVTPNLLSEIGSGNTGDIGYWNRTGTSLSPVNQGDDVLIGGTLPSAPNISLNANGNVELQRTIAYNATPTPWYTTVSDDSGLGYIFQRGSAYKMIITDAGDVKIGPGNNNNTINSAPNISLNANGLAYFDDTLTCGSTTTSNTGISARCNADASAAKGAVSAINYNSAGLVWRGRDGNDINTTTSKIFADGSAEFANSVLAFQSGKGRAWMARNSTNAFEAQTAAALTTAVIGYDGSAEFAGDVQVGGDAVSTEGCYIGSNGTFKAARDDANAVFVGRSTTSNSATFQVSGDGTVGIGGTLPSAPNITFYEYGSIVANRSDGASAGSFNTCLAGTVDGAGAQALLLFSEGSDGKTRMALRQSGQLLLGDNVTDDGGKISLTGSTGSANFSDVVNIGSWSSSDPAFSARLGGTNNFKFRANLSSPDSKIVDFHNNGSTDNEVVASISASGAGNFLGGVTVGGNGATQYKGSWISDGTLRIGGTLPSAPNIKLQAGGGIVAKNQIVSDRTSGNQQCFSARINNIENGGILASGKVFVIGNGTSAAPDISLNADGSAEFADAVKIGETGTGNTGAIIDNVGAFTSRVAGNTSKAFTVKTSANNDEKTVLYGDGSADFAGDVTANNVTFDVGTADEVNVRERLVEARERLEHARETFQELHVAVANSNDFSDLKAAMLVALEDYANGGN